ncbi:hypothetical protein Tco_0948902 [Tanacetum coccineum]
MGAPYRLVLIYCLEAASCSRVSFIAPLYFDLFGGNGNDESIWKCFDTMINAVVKDAWTIRGLFQEGSPAGIHGLFSGWYCGLATTKVTLGVSMAWAKGVTTGTLVRYKTSCGRLLGNLLEDKEVRRSGYYVFPTTKKSHWGTNFPTGLKRFKVALVETVGEGQLDHLSNARNRAGPAESGDSCGGKVKPKRGPA